MKFVLSLDCDNAAFCNNDGEERRSSAAAEVGRILTSAAENIEWDDSGTLRDANGNTVGRWAWEA